MYQIVTKQITKEMFYKDTSILKITIEYPQVENAYSPGVNLFNSYYKDRAMEYKEYCQTEIFKLAVEDYENSIKNGYPVHQYEAVLKSTITYNSNNIISLYSDKYEYLGGAHGSTIRDSQTWDIAYARMLKLDEFFISPNYIIDILKSINTQIAEQIKAGTGQYFDNYCQLVIENFNPNNFYLTESNIAIYYQQYEIAPYSSGIPVFLI